MVALLKSWFGYPGDVKPVPSAEPNETFRIGEYYADYTPLTDEELEQRDPVSEELFKRCKPVSR